MAEFVIKILENYLAWEELKQQKSYDKLSWNEKNNLRLQNDNDAKYYYEKGKIEKEEALKADTIISFWTPYCRLLKLEANWIIGKNAKTIGNLKALLKQIRATWKNDYTSKINATNERIEDFAKVCYTKGNYMLLPERKMNPQRYSVTEDRIDLTLYECFDKGALAKYYNTNDALCSWIIREKLDGIFLNDEISKEKIKWFISEDKPKWISEMSADEIYKYLENAVLLIQERNK